MITKKPVKNESMKKADYNKIVGGAAEENKEIDEKEQKNQ